MRRDIFSNRAFTLVELLVVIAIIALLIAILLPALNRAREAANTIKCAAQEKQIMIAFTVYTQDHRGVLPLPPLVGEFFDPNGSLMYYMAPVGKRPGMGFIRYDVGCFWPYLSPRVNKDGGWTGGMRVPRVLEQIMNCPSDPRGGRLVFFSGVVDQDRNFSYSWNSDIRGSVRRMNKIKQSSHKIVLVEELAPNDGYAVMQGDPDDEPTWRHNGRGNYGFADGHVETLYPYDMGFEKKSGSLDQHARVINPIRNNYYFSLNVDR